jgi:phosphonate ABC transporter permease subunit PhnE
VIPPEVPLEPEKTAPPTDEKKRNPFTRLLVIWLSILAVIIGYAFATQATDVDLGEIKDEQRRVQLIRIVRGLARPNIIEFDEVATFHVVEVATPCPPGGFDPPEPPADEPYIRMVPPCAAPQSEVTVQGFNFNPGQTGPLSFIPPSEVTLKLADIQVRADGTFETVVKLPDRPDETIQHLRFTTRVRAGDWQFTDTATDTWEKIIETVALALIATTVGTALAIPLSFFSARNLMRSIRTPLVSVGLLIVGIPVGILVGRQLGRWVTSVGEDLSGNALGLILALIAAAVFAFFALRWALPEEDAEPPPRSLRMARRAVLAVVVVGGLFVVGFFGHLLIWFGDKIEGPLDDLALPFGFVGDFFVVLGDLLTTFLTAMAATTAALAAAVWGSKFGHTVRDRVPSAALQPIRMVVAGAAGAIIAAGIGGAIRWLYEVDQSNNLMATSAGAFLLAIAGGGIALAVGRRLVPEGPGGTLLRFLIGVVGIGLGFFLGLGAGWLADMLLEPVNRNGTLWGPALVGAVLGIAAAISTRKLDSLPSGMLTYYISRTLFNAIRSVEPLVMAIVFVVWVGIGPFAGSLALALHTTAALAKLYSEQVESILPGPMEAVTATGATRLQNIVYAVTPQIVPPYIAFTLYRWDINVRMSTIIGFAGGGGIGFLLQQNINLLQYRDASVQMLAIAVVVSTLDFVSARIRERIV